MKFTKQLTRSLSFRIAVPVILFVMASGTVLFILMLTLLTDFVQSNIQSDMQGLARDIYIMCDNSIDDLMKKRRIFNKIAVRIKKVKTAGVIGDFMRKHDLMGVIIGENQVILNSENLPELNTLNVTFPENQLISRQYKDKKYYLWHFRFEPWDWRIILIKDTIAYSSLINRIKFAYLAMGILLVVGMILLLYYLRRNINLPVNDIIDSLKRNKQPNHKDISEFEFLEERGVEGAGKMAENFRGVLATLNPDDVTAAKKDFKESFHHNI